MPNGLYDSNRIYITPTEQYELTQPRILLAGAGLGSVIAESALRLGFRRFRIVDFDDVELSNLNRQNYERSDIGYSKTSAISRRLRSIDSNIELESVNKKMDTENIPTLLSSIDIVVNCLDFDTNAPDILDHHAQKLGLPVIHPINLQWAASCSVILPDSPTFLELYGSGLNSVDKLIDSHCEQQAQSGKGDLTWLRQAWATLKVEIHEQSFPQLRIGADLCAALTCRLLFALATGKTVRPTPHIYINSIYEL